MTETDVIERRQYEQDVVAAMAPEAHRFIVANTHDEAWHYAKTQGWEPASWSFVARVTQLQLQSHVDIHFVGDWRHRPDASKIALAAAQVPGGVWVTYE